MNQNKMPFGELDTCSSHHITIEPTLAPGGQPGMSLTHSSARPDSFLSYFIYVFTFMNDTWW